jgi:hypothetical protein
VMATIMQGLIPPVPPASIKQYAFKRKRLSLSLSLSLSRARSLFYSIKQYAFKRKRLLFLTLTFVGLCRPTHRIDSLLFNRQIQTQVRQKIIETDAHAHRNHSARRIRETERERETEG